MRVSLEGVCATSGAAAGVPGGTRASTARLWLLAGLVGTDRTGPDETEKEFLGDDPPKPQCRDAKQKRPSSRLSPKKSLYAYPKSCGLRVRLLIQHTSRDQGRHRGDGEASRSRFHAVSAPVPVRSVPDAPEKSWYPAFCSSQGTSPGSRALMARAACAHGFSGTAAKTQFVPGGALRGRCRRSREKSLPRLSPVRGLFPFHALQAAA